jgi:transcriptional regulator with XRE-family HTH domain/predicted transcriptional regulator
VPDFFDTLVLGRRLRYVRKQKGLTLEELGRRVGRQAPYLSMVENGRREPRLSLVNALAKALGVKPASLLDPEPPDRRSQLEIAVLRAQRDPVYGELHLPYLKPNAGVSDAALQHIVALYHELKRRSAPRPATPEQARKANVELLAELRERDNYLLEIEIDAKKALEAVDYPGSGAISQRMLTDLAAHYGFRIEQVQDLPAAVRSITDSRNGRIYIPQRDSLRTRAARSVVLQTLGHFVLDHRDPVDFGDFLRQRMQANYFAAAVLVPEEAAVPFLLDAKEERDLAIEDLKEVFYVSYEMAAHRFCNLITKHAGIRVHFVRSDEEGIAWKAYENDGVPFPTDEEGNIVGQRLCREWGARAAFSSPEKFSIHDQWTDTPGGTYFCSTFVEVDRTPIAAVTIGTPMASARFFRGRDTARRVESQCPDPNCCRRPPSRLAERWEGFVWPSPRPHSHVVAALPSGRFPGVDLTAVYEFLDAHTTEIPP